MLKKIEKATQCANCETSLNGENYCPNCGQLNNVKFPSLWDFIGDSISNFFAFDGKFFNTIHILFRYPGRLAKEYILGKRVRYMPPIRIYFLASILLLFIIKMRDADSTMIKLQETTEEVADTIPVKKNIGIAEQSNDPTRLRGKFSRMYDLAKRQPGLMPESAMDSLGLPPSYLNKWFYKQSYKAANIEDDEISKFFYSKLFWVFFLFLPFFAFFLKLIYVRRKFLYLEHLFFAFYTQSAFFILLSLGFIIDIWVEKPYFPVIFIFVFAIYLWLALRRFYNQKFLKTTLKFFLINFGFIVFAALFFIIAAFISFLVY